MSIENTRRKYLECISFFFFLFHFIERGNHLIVVWFKYWVFRKKFPNISRILFDQYFFTIFTQSIQLLNSKSNHVIHTKLMNTLITFYEGFRRIFSIVFFIYWYWKQEVGKNDCLKCCRITLICCKLVSSKFHFAQWRFT